MSYCIVAYAASADVACRELCDLHDCCISADMDGRGGGGDGVTQGKEDRGANEMRAKGKGWEGGERRGDGLRGGRKENRRR